MKRTIATLVIAAVPVLTAAPATAAGPSSNPNADILLDVTCSNGFTGTIVGTSPVGHLESGAAVGVVKGYNGVLVSGKGIDASRLITCTSPSAPGVEFDVLPVPQGG